MSLPTSRTANLISAPPHRQSPRQAGLAQRDRVRARFLTPSRRAMLALPVSPIPFSLYRTSETASSGLPAAVPHKSSMSLSSPDIDGLYDSPTTYAINRRTFYRTVLTQSGEVKAREPVGM